MLNLKHICHSISILRNAPLFSGFTPFSVAIHNGLPYHFWWPNHAKHHGPSVEAMDVLATILHPKDDQDFDVEDLEAIVTSMYCGVFSRFHKNTHFKKC